MRRNLFTGLAIAVAAAGIPAFAFAQTAKMVPVFEVDANFPTLPAMKLLGGVGGATAGASAAGVSSTTVSSTTASAA